MTQPCAHIDLRSVDAGMRLLNRALAVDDDFVAKADLVRVTPRHAVASGVVCCALRVLKQRVWPCEQVFRAAFRALDEHATAQPAGAAACEGCCQAAQALVVTLRKSLMRLSFTLTGESVALVCSVPPCPAHHALLQGWWLTRRILRNLPRAPDAWGRLLALQARAQSCCIWLLGIKARPGRTGLPRHFFTFICRELLPPLMANFSTILESLGDVAGSGLLTVVHPVTAIVFVVRLGPLGPRRGPHACAEPWPDTGAGPHTDL
jgi:hypothetical protein